MKTLLLTFLSLVLIQTSVVPTRSEPKDVQGSLHPPLFLYHRFGPVVAGSMTVSTTHFESQLEYLRNNGHTTIPRRQRENRAPTSSVVGTSIGKKPPLARQSAPAGWRIVIDPGHGGDNLGAIGPDGLMEKDVVLGIAKKLRDILMREPGCQPILTREDDTFISLGERTAIANTQKADIFLSVHANASPNLKTRGIETYVLNSTTNKESMELAARENAASTRKLTDLQYILYDLWRTQKINGSRRLAELVQRSICKGLAESYSQVYDLGVKEAPFHVLVGANMPSILVEVSFISNRLEEHRLKDDKYLDKLVGAIKEGIVHYMRELGNYPTA